MSKAPMGMVSAKRVVLAFLSVNLIVDIRRMWSSGEVDGEV